MINLFFIKLPNRYKSYLRHSARVVLLLLLLLALCSCNNTNDRFHDPQKTDNTSDTRNSVKVAILMYHAFTDGEEDSTHTSQQKFEAQLNALINAGYQAVSLDDLCNWVEGNGVLPEKPFVVTSDDGYKSVYEYAFPVLKKYHIPATIYCVGITYGLDTYPADEKPMNPHFGDAERIEMSEYEISCQCHSWNMHQVSGRDPNPIREGLIQFENENDNAFRQIIREDLKNFQQQCFDFKHFSYPYGKYSDISEGVLDEYNIKTSVTTNNGTTVIKKNDSTSLRLMNRINVGAISCEELLDAVSK